MFDTLILSGAGMEIGFTIGCLKVLEENNLLKNFKNYYGVSAGSIISLLLLIEYDIKIIEKLFKDINFNNLIDPNLNRLFVNYGFDNFNNLDKLIKIICKKKNINENTTFIHLFNKTNRFLNISGTNKGTGNIEYFNYLRTPNMNIFVAIRISCAIPFIFTPVEWNNTIWLDGIIKENFPYNLSKSKYKLGILITSFKEKNLEELKKEDLKDYILSTLSLISSSDCDKYEKYKNENVVCNYNNYENIVNFNKNTDNKNENIQFGIYKMNEFLKTYYKKQQIKYYIKKYIIKKNKITPTGKLY